ncbi:hypothetical protein PTI98_000553 [Pleurotus ostreatus]|nr:hypothetical protein PTI98_000553 [Pleurotus ostreatus]
MSPSRGGATGFYAIEHELEAWHKNHWNQVANATETVVVRFKNKTLTVNDVKGNDLLLVYSDTFIRVPTAEQVHFT